MQLALQKLEKKEVSPPSTPVPNNNRLSGRRGSNTKTTNYREEASDDEGGGDEDGSPSKVTKGKIFRTKENVKDRRKSKSFRRFDTTIIDWSYFLFIKLQCFIIQ